MEILCIIKIERTLVKAMVKMLKGRIIPYNHFMQRNKAVYLFFVLHAKIDLHIAYFQFLVGFRKYTIIVKVHSV